MKKSPSTSPPGPSEDIGLGRERFDGSNFVKRERVNTVQLVNSLSQAIVLDERVNTDRLVDSLSRAFGFLCVDVQRPNWKELASDAQYGELPGMSSVFELRSHLPLNWKNDILLKVVSPEILSE